MIKKITVLCLAMLTGFRMFALPTPDEGMWLPLYLKQYNEKDMQRLGMRITADDIYNINHSSIKDAVVRMGGGFCTGELVSGEGLLFTNHHCGYEKIAEHSTVEHDYLKNGFWAKSHKEELPNPGLTVSRLVYMKDLTASFNAVTSAIKDKAAKRLAIDSMTKDITTKEVKGTHFEAEVKTYFNGNEYYLLVYETFKDVRLVGAPPASIGKFGGDVDNWMWPRHTGDFSVFRVYTDKDGNPAEYSADNIPYKPKHFFPVSLKGIKQGDYSMVMGYPGQTERYLTSYDIEYNRDIQNPVLIKYMETMLDVMKKDMDADRALSLKMAADYASLSNSYKYFLGQERLLKTPDPSADVVQIKRKMETDFTQWVNASPERKEKYGSILSDIKSQLDSRREFEPAYSLQINSMFSQPLLNYTFGFYQFKTVLKEGKDKPVQSEVDTAVKHLKGKAGDYISGYKFKTDRKIFQASLTMLFNELPESSYSDMMKNVLKEYKGKSKNEAVALYVDDLYKKSLLLDSMKAEKWLKKPNYKKLEKDPMFAFMESLVKVYVGQMMVSQPITRTLGERHKLYMQAIREFMPDKTFYPDANSTMRLSYGNVKAYVPRDGEFYKYYTTYMGILEKYDAKNPEFEVPEREIKLLKDKNWGRYAENDTLRVCFITNNDITGGNSGSPVIDADGNLIGLAFDGDWESMIGDLHINPKVNRTIAVDVRYVLWVIDIYADAKNLINELDIKQ